MNTRCLEFEVLPFSGDLKICLTEEGKDELALIRDENPNIIWDELLESYSTNGSYTRINPEDIGALTSAPIITDHLEIDENDEDMISHGHIYWFPQYETVDELEELYLNGFVIFTKAD